MARKLYTRADLEEDLVMIDAVRAELNRLLLKNKLNGRKFNELRDKLDEEERRARMKLVGTSLAIADRDASLKDKIAISEENGKVFRKSAGKWVETNDDELLAMHVTGAKFAVVGGNGGTERRFREMNVPVERRAHFATWRRVSRDDARKAQGEGKNVRWGDDPNFADVLD